MNINKIHNWTEIQLLKKLDSFAKKYQLEQYSSITKATEESISYYLQANILNQYLMDLVKMSEKSWENSWEYDKKKMKLSVEIWKRVYASSATYDRSLYHFVYKKCSEILKEHNVWPLITSTPTDQQAIQDTNTYIPAKTQPSKGEYIWAVSTPVDKENPIKTHNNAANARRKPSKKNNCFVFPKSTDKKAFATLCDSRKKNKEKVRSNYENSEYTFLLWLWEYLYNHCKQQFDRFDQEILEKIEEHRLNLIENSTPDNNTTHYKSPLEIRTYLQNEKVNLYRTINSLMNII